MGKELDRGEGGEHAPVTITWCELSAYSRKETCAIVADRPEAVSQGASGFSLLG